MEALEFLTKNENHYAFASNSFGETKEAIKFVKALYAAGAEFIEVDNIYNEESRIKSEGGPYADTLVIHLPKSKSKRLALVPVVFGSHPDELGGDWNSNKPLILWWD